MLLLRYAFVPARGGASEYETSRSLTGHGLTSNSAWVVYGTACWCLISTERRKSNLNIF